MTKYTGTKGTVPQELQSLYDYINTKLATSDFIQNIADTIIEIKNDKKVRQDFMTYAMRMKDIHNAAFAEGEAIGEARGKAEGEAKEKFATAKRLLAMKLSLQDISKATTLPIVKIQALQAEMLHTTI